MSYPIPKTINQAKIEIKKSRFISLANHIIDKAEAKAWLASIKDQYPDANHHCWAYQIGNPNCALSAGMGDDGEPSGSAGKPILNVLQHKNVGDIMIIVVRYFGGIKLGAGGLTRAYGQSAQAVMTDLEIIEQIDLIQLQLQIDFKDEQFVRHCCDLFAGKIVEIEYTNQVNLLLDIPANFLCKIKYKFTEANLTFKQLIK